MPRGGPRTKKVITEETVPVEDRSKSDLDLAEYMDGIGTASREIKIFRIVGARQKWVATVDDPKLINEEAILEQYGPGRYLIRAKDSDGKWLPSKIFEIEGPEAVPSQNPPAHYQLQGTENMSDMLMMMQQSSKEMMQMFMAMQQQTTQIIVAALGNGSKGGSVAELVQGLAGLKALEPKPQGDDLERLKNIMEIAEHFGGNGGGPKGTVEALIDGAAKILPSIMEARMLAAGNPPEDVQTHSIQTGQPLTPEEKQRQLEDGQRRERYQLQEAIKLHWTRLTKAAQKDMDPEGLAGSFLDLEELDDLAASAILQSVLQAATFDEWLKVTGPITDDVKPWMEKFYNAVRELTKEEGGTDASTSTDTQG